MLIRGDEDVYCQMCGILPGDIDERTGRKARFSISLFPNNGIGRPRTDANLRILCSTCNQGAKNVTSEKPTSIWLLSQIRRAGMHEQKAVFDWLSKKFTKQD